MSNNLEDGYTRIANGLLDEAAKRKFSGSQFRIILVIWRYTYGFHRKSHYFSLTFLSEQTGLNKDLIKREVKKLIDSKVLFIAKDPTFNKSRELGFNKYYDQWAIPSNSTEETKKNTGGKLDPSRGGEKVTSTGGELAPQIKKEKENNKEIYSQLDDGMPITDDAVHEISSDDQKLQAIENHYVQKRGRGLQVSAKDIASMKSVITEGIPLEIIIEGINLAFDTFKPEYDGDCIRTFSYCATAIREHNHITQERLKPAEKKEYTPRSNWSGRKQEVRKDTLPTWIEQQQQEAENHEQEQQNTSNTQESEERMKRIQERLRNLERLKEAANH